MRSPTGTALLAISLVALCSAGLAACGGAGHPTATSTTRSKTRPLAAPVLDVTSFPCPAKQVSTIDIERCEERKIAMLNRRINALGRVIFARLRAADEITHRFDHSFPVDYGRRAFISGEQAWLRYRNAFCRSEGNIAEGGTAAGIDSVYCEASIDAQHVKDLTAFYKALGPH